jgi:hypothetical protein
MAISLTNMITNVRQRCDMPNGTFVTDAEITHYINDEIHTLYSKMVNVDDGSLFGTVAPTMSTVGDNAYACPSDFMRLIDVNIYTGSQWVPANQADPQSYYQLLDDTYTGDYDTNYFLRRNNAQDRYELFIFPAKAVANVGVRYIPEMEALSIGSDTLKWPSNWHLVPIVGAAIKCLVKEESDPSGLMFEYGNETNRILKDIRSQTVANIKTIRSIGNRVPSSSRFRLPRLH